MEIISELINNYSKSHTKHVSEILNELEVETKENTEMPQMMIGPVAGSLLKYLVKISGAKRVLEIGTFTGYSALCMAEGLPHYGKLITCDVDLKTTAIAQKYFSRSPDGSKIEIRIGPALETMKSLNLEFDFIFVDADKTNYPLYYEEGLSMLKQGGIMVFDNMFWDGGVFSSGDDVSKVLDKLNKDITSDSRVENILLTIRDGMMLVIKK